MRLLFIHQNFPGQYKHLAVHHAAKRGYEVVGVGEKGNLLRAKPQIAGVKLLAYDMSPVKGDSLQRAIARGKRVASGAARLRSAGFVPDVIFAHIGWGEALFLKDVFPEARILLYCEFFYRAKGADLGFDPEFPATPEKVLRLRLMNAPLLMSLDASDFGIAPTRWQHREFSPVYQPRIAVVHDG
ncbi:MAG TPA: glycosyl transferase family 1, partial [Burkholderiales bacterium]|nr:glycosyl transferase family 1 [Burkholderiales bacterium]